MSIHVLNKRSLNDALPGIARVYVGRPSPLGNPFKIGPDGSRADVVAKYRQWLWREIQADSSAVRQELERLHALSQHGSLELVCWCAPQACHADVIARAIHWLEHKN